MESIPNAQEIIQDTENIENNENIAKYEQQMSQAIKVLKPETADLDEYTQQVLEALHGEILQNQLQNNSLEKTEEDTYREMSELLIRKIEKIIINHEKKIDTKIPTGIVRKAKIALLVFRGNPIISYDDFRRDIYGSDKLDIVRLEWYLGVYMQPDHSEVKKFTSDEIGFLAELGFCENILDLRGNQFDKYFKNQRFPESFLMNVTEKDISITMNYNARFKFLDILKNNIGENSVKYSKDCLKHILSILGKGSYKLLDCLDAFSFDREVWIDLVSVAGAESPYNIKELLKYIKGMDSIDDNERIVYIKTAIQSQLVTDEDFYQVPEIKDLYPEVVSEVRQLMDFEKQAKKKQIVVTKDPDFPVQYERFQKLVSSGFYNFVANPLREYISLFIERDRDWFVSEIVKHNQEIFLLPSSRNPDAVFSDVDKSLYAKKLINSDKEYILKALVGYFSENTKADQSFFKKNSFTLDIYQDLVDKNKQDTIGLEMFTGLPQDLFEATRKERKLSGEEIKSFDLQYGDFAKISKTKAFDLNPNSVLELFDIKGKERTEELLKNFPGLEYEQLSFLIRKNIKNKEQEDEFLMLTRENIELISHDIWEYYAEYGAEKTKILIDQKYNLETTKYLIKKLKTIPEDTHSTYLESFSDNINTLLVSESAKNIENNQELEYICRQVYPQRNYNAYPIFDQFTDKSQDLDQYVFNKKGYLFDLGIYPVCLAAACAKILE